MQLAIVGLGRMGSGVAERLLRGGHEVLVFNRTPEKAEVLRDKGAKPVSTLVELVDRLTRPRTIWLYLPSGSITTEYIEQLTGLLSPGDVIIDGGNSHFVNSMASAEALSLKGIHFIDVGTSGGVAGREAGYCLMIGGEATLIEYLSPLWQAVAQERGYKRVGPVGAGHYVKMVHNAIEYGMMQAYAEGMDLLAASRFGNDLHLPDIAEVWQHGSIIRSYLGDLLNQALLESPELGQVSPRIEDNGEGRWAIQEAVNLGVPIPVITSALYARYQSKKDNSFANRVVTILRNKFGGHNASL